MKINSVINYNYTYTIMTTYIFPCCRDGDFEAVQKLLDEGTNLDLRDGDGMTLLMTASSNGYTDIVRLLLEKGADPNILDSHGWTALELACGGIIPIKAGAFKKIVSMLIEKGANINHNCNGWGTSLMFQSIMGNYTNVETLLNYGANPNIQNKRGYTAINYASSKGYSDIVNLLIENGATLPTNYNE